MKHDTVFLQQSIDKAATRGGGEVVIPSGVHVLRAPLELRSGVHLRGEDGAVLTRAPSVCSALADYLGYGFQEFSAAEPELFEVGMAVQIADDNAPGFYSTNAVITEKRGGYFFIDRPLNHDYLPGNGGHVTTLFSLINGQNVADVSIQNLIIDGNVAETRVLNGCRGGGIFLIGARNIQINNCEVRNYRGDAISFQQCADIEVRACRLHHNTGSGLHPGSGSVRYVFVENYVHDNGGCGIFYCLRTTHSRCENNRIASNALHGISIGERDTDHLIRANKISNNGGAGIHFRPALHNGGDRVRIEENFLRENCRHESAAEIEISAGIHDIYISGNTLESSTHAALVVAKNCARISFFGNKINVCAQQKGDVTGATEAVELKAPQETFPVGPQALPLDGARHLGIETLPVWKEVLA